MEQRRQTFLYLSVLICIWSALAKQQLYGLHTDELIAGELIVPRKVNKNGDFLTHNLTHFHDEHYYHEQRRRSRHSAAILAAGNELHYRLEIGNASLHLELEPHNYFMTPHLIVERHRRDLRTRQRPTAKNANCHYHGRIRGDAISSVAISTCGGLVGHIKTQNNEYYIEPSKQHYAHPTNGHRHVVFHRSSVKQKQHQQQDNRMKQKNQKRKQRRQLRKQQQRQHQRQHQLYRQHQRQTLAVSNCGTKEPRRRIETRLEWQPQGKVRSVYFLSGGKNGKRGAGVKIQGGRKVHYRHPHSHRIQQQQKEQLELKPSDHPQAKIKYKYHTTEEVSAMDKSSTSSTSPLDADTVIDADADTTATQSQRVRGRNHRLRRSISSPRHVEALIVADATMVAFHNNVETYLLTIMNMVSALYKDPSIGNSIEIVVVKIVLLEEDEAHPDLNLTQNAQQNLDTFCGWQHKLNTVSENDPHHHDVAILITRKNICGNNCMTLGLANVGGMCKPKQSCSVNEDNGIMLSHTIAHELGHNFGMFHDTAKIGCHPRVGSIVHIMTPTFGADTLQVCWSNCSRKYITHFLDQGLGECLDDAPIPLDEYVYPEVPPGVMYNAELQCRLQFNLTDSDVGTCSSINEICSTLWCQVNGECVTNMRPTAPGTNCGKRKWCQNGKCVRMAEITPIDGGWGNWSEWSKCSRSCGGGVAIKQRECNSPVPANGGLFCIGERKRYKICNKEPCPDGEPSFRGKQCSNFDHVPYQGATYKWLPFFDKNNPCKLVCTDIDDTIISNWGDVVLNGTPCTLGTKNMCIDGICKKVGCDWIVDSNLQEDRCGICGGTGDQCKPVKEIFDEPLNVADGYVEIVTIPSKARHIVIKELSNSANFLGIARANSSAFYLNGDSLISMPGEFIIAGAESLYDRVDEQETINIPQPIEHSIALYVIVRSGELNAGVYYEFTLPVVNVSSGTHYTWKLSDWTSCSTTCGGGVQYREPLCHEHGKLIFDDVLCWSHAQNTRPPRRTRACNQKPCPAHWLVGPWQFCPVTCREADAPPPLKQRSVMCLGHNDVVIEDAKCKKSLRPVETEPCDYLPDCRAVEKFNSVLYHMRNL